MTGLDHDAAAVERVVGDCAVYEHGRRRAGRVPLARAASAAAGTDGFVWVGLQQPTADDVEAVAAEFGLPALAVEDAVKAHQRPKLERYGDVVFVVLKPVSYVDSEEVIRVSEIAVFLGRDFVVTVRHGDSPVLREVRAQLEQGDETATLGPMSVLHQAADHVVDEYERAIAAIDDDIAEIEAQVFSTDSGDHAERIYELKREVLEFRRAVAPLAAPLSSLAAGGVPGTPAELRPYFRDVHDHLLRAADTIDGQDRLLTDVLQANVARVGVQQSPREVTIRLGQLVGREGPRLQLRSDTTLTSGFAVAPEHAAITESSVNLGETGLPDALAAVLGRG